MADEYSWEATLRRVIDQMVETGVTELDIRRDDLRLRLRRRIAETSMDGESADQVVASQGSPAENSQETHPVLAPLTGVFYASPNPSARPYVGTGDWVEEGTVVGLIETMKVFNEVMVDCRGRIVAVLAQQGQLVQSGDAVALVDTSATAEQAVEVAP